MKLFRVALLAGIVVATIASATVSFAASDQSVSIANFAFAPSEVSVPVGSSVTWTNNQDGVPHTTTALDRTWDSGVLSTNDSFSFTFTQAGDFAYQCAIHPSMRGIVHVLADAGSQPDSSATTSAAQADTTARQTTVAAPSAGQVDVAQPATATPVTQATVAAPSAAQVDTAQPATPAPVVTPTPAATHSVPALRQTATPTAYYGY